MLKNIEKTEKKGKENYAVNIFVTLTYMGGKNKDEKVKRELLNIFHIPLNIMTKRRKYKTEEKTDYVFIMILLYEVCQKH